LLAPNFYFFTRLMKIGELFSDYKDLANMDQLMTNQLL
jgi:hypothetical protein